MYGYVIADVFTDTPLYGNPVAVFTDASGITATMMQRIAQELHLSETTFVLPGDESADIGVRIFTPVNELPFAGHPALGTAVVLGESLGERFGDSLRMRTANGVVPFTFERRGGRIVKATMCQPVPVWQPYEHAGTLLAGLGLSESTMSVDAYRNGPRHVFVGCSGIEELSAIDPDLRTLGRLPDMAAICFATAETHWRMRMFSPAYGVAEDAATGSAAGPLAIHLIRHGRLAYSEWIEVRQGVEMGRPSTMWASIRGEGDRIDAVRVSGAAVVVGRGELLL